MFRVSIVSGGSVRAVGTLTKEQMVRAAVQAVSGQKVAKTRGKVRKVGQNEACRTQPGGTSR
jgi:hypothetical protein